ncbi:MAG: DUF177 domain-containing protein [Elusimicrobia bacterium]|nr:DUF177 domain-containing protein [Elusimicrobiota bacterium]
MGNLRFAVSEIKEHEGLEFTGPVPLEELASQGLFGEAVPQGPATVQLEFSVGGSRILVEGSVEERWQLPCNRCLALHPVTLSGAVEETFPATTDTIDLGEEVRQALVLSLPERSLCREDCKGLCAGCGANLNQGPCACARA